MIANICKKLIGSVLSIKKCTNAKITTGNILPDNDI
jgi:hypothetical protein